LRHDAADEKNKFMSILIAAALSKRGTFLTLPNWRDVQTRDKELMARAGKVRDCNLHPSPVSASFQKVKILADIEMIPCAG